MPHPNANWLRILLTRRMAVSLVMGFSCGVPLMLTLTVLQAWLKAEGVDLAVIGLMALVGLPYTLKFVWAPVLDRFTPRLFGRRRGWLLAAQSALMVSIIALGRTDPVATPGLLAGIAFLVTFFSASQDIVVDAYRREDVADEELGLASSLYINGYRIGMLVSSGGGLILADHVPFSMVYLIMALAMVPGIVTTLLTPEPDVASVPPDNIRSSVVEPLTDFFRRPGAVWILAFIFFYKLGDTMASAITIPFYLDVGFSNTEIGTVVKLFGFWATMGGALAGGVLTLKIGIQGGLWVFGILQALSTAGFAILSQIGHNTVALAGVIAFENLSSGMGTAAFVAFMAIQTNKRFTATQYALLSSLMGVPRVMAAAPTGYLAEALGWAPFFMLCALMAVPGLLILLRFSTWRIGAVASPKDLEN